MAKEAGWEFGLSVAGTLVGVGSGVVLLSVVPPRVEWWKPSEFDALLCLAWILAHLWLGSRIGRAIDRSTASDDQE